MRSNPGDWCRRSETASVGVRNLSLAVAGSAFNGIDLAAWLCWLLHRREARSVASNARMLFDFWRHVETFQAASVGGFSTANWHAPPSPTAIAPSGFRYAAKTAACKSLNYFRLAGAALPTIGVSAISRAVTSGRLPAASHPPAILATLSPASASSPPLQPASWPCAAGWPPACSPGASPPTRRVEAPTCTRRVDGLFRCNLSS
jgi:hypothetical protein